MDESIGISHLNWIIASHYRIPGSETSEFISRRSAKHHCQPGLESTCSEIRRLEGSRRAEMKVFKDFCYLLTQGDYSCRARDDVEHFVFSFIICCRPIQQLLGAYKRNMTPSSASISSRPRPIMIEEPFHLLKQLSYTLAVIKEALSARVAGSRGFILDAPRRRSAIFPPRAVRWGLHIQAIHRDPRYWS